MKKNTVSALIAILLLAISGILVSAETKIEVVTPGEWTMDLDAAKKVAAEKKLPLLINFSGSDWCGWCKLMEKNVFSTSEWKDYAKDNILMVVIDFPNNAALVPEKYRARNEELKEKYGVQGFPSFVVLDDNAETELGRLGAGQDVTPPVFIEQLSMLFKSRPAEMEKYTKKLKPEAAAAYRKIITQISENEKAIARKQQDISAAEKSIEELEEKTEALRASACEFRATQLGVEELAKYRILKADFDKAREELAKWIGSKPDRSQENMEKYQKMVENIQAIEKNLSKY